LKSLFSAKVKRSLSGSKAVICSDWQPPYRLRVSMQLAGKNGYARITLSLYLSLSLSPMVLWLGFCYVHSLDGMFIEVEPTKDWANATSWWSGGVLRFFRSCLAGDLLVLLLDCQTAVCAAVCASVSQRFLLFVEFGPETLSFCFSLSLLCFFLSLLCLTQWDAVWLNP